MPSTSGRRTTDILRPDMYKLILLILSKNTTMAVKNFLLTFSLYNFITLLLYTKDSKTKNARLSLFPTHHMLNRTHEHK